MVSFSVILEPRLNYASMLGRYVAINPHNEISRLLFPFQTTMVIILRLCQSKKIFFPENTKMHNLKKLKNKENARN